jgi:hypothetical protein
MGVYLVKKLFEQFNPGDELKLNERQAKYLLMSGHIVAVETVIAAKTEQELTLEPLPEQQVETEPQPVQEQAEETDASAAGKKKVKKGE